ncbi:MAG: sulfite exporter TauE/SafE family protein, partial [Acidimicrobiia bacterium]
GLSAVVGYRRELRGQRERVLRLGSASVAGGLTGSVLLLALPESVFDAVVPALVLLGVVLVAVQPRVTARLAARRGDGGPDHGGPPLLAGVFLTGVYGGYFGAGQGIVLLALLGILVADDLQRLNGVKNALAMAVNAVAALVFVLVADVAWEVVGLVAVGSVVGAQLGAAFGRRLPPNVLRAVVVVVGLVAVARLLA